MHLQYLGHPIANDGQYGGTFPGPLRPGLNTTDPATASAAATAPAAAAAAVASVASSGPPSAAAEPEASPRKRIRLDDGGSIPAAVGERELSTASCGTAAERDGDFPLPAAVTAAAAAGAAAVGGKREASAAEREPPAAAERIAVAGSGAGARPGPAAAGVQNVGGGPAEGGLTEGVGVAGVDGDEEREGEDRNRGERRAGPPRLEDLPEVEKKLQDSMCLHCPALPPVGYPIDLRPLWLHARMYSSREWSFECPLPEWASPEFAPVE